MRLGPVAVLMMPPIFSRPDLCAGPTAVRRPPVACGTGGITFRVGNMTSRPPIHLGSREGSREGSGEPVLLLHGFLMSQTVWDPVAPRLANTGRYEVFAPTMAGHNGGPYAGTWL